MSTSMPLFKKNKNRNKVVNLFTRFAADHLLVVCQAQASLGAS